MFCRLRQCRQILPKLNLSAILLLFLIKRAALGNLKVNFHCAHWHRFFPLKKGLSKTHQSSLSLKGGSTSHLGLLPSGKKRKPPYSVLKPLRYKVGGPSEVFASSRAAFCGMRPHGYESLTGCRKAMKPIAARPEPTVTGRRER